jgi:hypothetical protein
MGQPAHETFCREPGASAATQQNKRAQALGQSRQALLDARAEGRGGLIDLLNQN